MLSKRQRTDAGGGQLREVSRPPSGGSTTSNDASMQQDLAAEPNIKYAPFRPTMQSAVHDQRSGARPDSLRGPGFGDHAPLESIHHYNQSEVNTPLEPPEAATASRESAYPIPPSSFDQLQHEAVENVRRDSESRAGSLAPGQNGGTDQEKKDRKMANSTAANEKELRELIDKNKERSLESIARDVRNAERTQKSEKAKQLFAMRWLRQFCRVDAESVPRSRVYTHYAQRCGTERVDTLNPASFGKLVRIIFPGIQTRRLGVRGESKYHYVSLALIDDPTVQGRPSSAHDSVTSVRRGTPMETERDFRSSMRGPDTSVFPIQDSTFDRPHSSQDTNPPSQHSLFAVPRSASFRHDVEGPQMYKQNLRFSPAHQELPTQNGALELPSLKSFMPPSTDMDIADALTVLYRTHCTSLVDAVRYVKEKQFIRLLGSFNGTMTVPVSRLFSSPGLAPWIKACDRVMYQHIIKFVSQLALQVIPPQVFTMLQSISRDLTDHIRRNFRNFPDHVGQAKLEVATVFSSLLQRLLRVNETAHAAANLLMQDDMRNLMWQDWVKSVRPKRVIESSISACGQEEAYLSLTGGIRRLLAPLPPAEWLEFGTEYQDSSMTDISNDEWLNANDPGVDSIIERWAIFLRQIPTKFPAASTRMIIHTVESLGNAAMRDITVNQAQSFGAWWITKAWVDEMMLWLAEMGGFLDMEISNLEAMPQNDVSEDSFAGVLKQGETRGVTHPSFDSQRASSAGPGIDFNNLPTFTPGTSQVNGHRHSVGPIAATYRMPGNARAKSKLDSASLDFPDEHDDSGIGMSLLDDATSLSRPEVSNAEQMTHNGMQAYIR